MKGKVIIETPIDAVDAVDAKGSMLNLLVDYVWYSLHAAPTRSGRKYKYQVSAKEIERYLTEHSKIDFIPDKEPT